MSQPLWTQGQHNWGPGGLRYGVYGISDDVIWKEKENPTGPGNKT
jgi:hypothetical protein